MIVLFVLSVIFVLIPLCIYLLWKYADRSTNHPVVLCIVFLGWLLSFSVLILVPIDVESTLAERCEYFHSRNTPCPTPSPFHVDHSVLEAIWAAVYWGTFAFCWVITPLAQEYVEAGGFTVWRKARYSLRNNAIVFGVFALVFLAFVIYMAIATHMRGDSLIGFVIAAANCWGLFMLICLLGHGLVAVPRRLWHAGNRVRTLRYFQFRAGRAYEELDDARGELGDVVDDLKAAVRAAPKNDPDIAKCISILIAAVPSHFNLNLSLSNDSNGTSYSGSRSTPAQALDIPTVDIPYLEKLHYQLKRTNFAVRTSYSRLQRMVVKVTELEDIIKSIALGSSKVNWSYRSPRTGSMGSLLDSLEFTYLARVKPIWTRVLAVILGCLSLIISWCEVTIFKTDPDYSLLSRLVHARESRFMLQILVFCAVAYMVHVSFSSLFHLRIFSFYRLSHKQTDPTTLLYNTSMLMRLASPLVFNYLYLIHEMEDTAFAKVTTDINEVPLSFGRIYNVYFPIVIVLVSLSSLFHIGPRLLRCFSIQRFELLVDDDDDSATSSSSTTTSTSGGGLLAEGKKIVHKEQERIRQGVPDDIYGLGPGYMERKAKRENRNRFDETEMLEMGTHGTASAAAIDMEFSSYGGGAIDGGSTRPTGGSPLQRSLLEPSYNKNINNNLGGSRTSNVGRPTGRAQIFGGGGGSSSRSGFDSPTRPSGGKKASRPPPKTIISIDDL